MNQQLSATEYEEIETLITCDDSPVGIDAKKTHIIIIGMLQQIEERLARLEGLVGGRDDVG